MNRIRFIKQAIADYDGTPNRFAYLTDPCGEVHVIIEMSINGVNNYLDWIGAELAPEPDEWCDEVPDYTPEILWTQISPLELARAKAQIVGQICRTKYGVEDQVDRALDAYMFGDNEDFETLAHRLAMEATYP